MGVYISEINHTYNVGDRVRMVSHPLREMVFGWNDIMTTYCGWIGTIRKIEWVSYKNSYAFYFEEFTWTWDYTCFEPIDFDTDEDFDVEESELLKLLGF